MTETAGEVRVALAHDYLTQRGGAERVVLRMVEAFPDAPLHTSVYEPTSTFPDFSAVQVRTSPLNYVSALRHDHRRALPLLAPTFSAMKITDAEVVLASSSGWAHGVRTDAAKVVYCHNPARWLYQSDQYLAGSGRLARTALALGRRPLTRWDHRAARRVDRYLCQSTVVRERIRATYGLDAEIVPAPGGIDATGPHTPPPDDPPDDGYALCVARLQAYKNVDAVVRAFADLPHLRLIVVGDGPEGTALRSSAPANVQFVGSVDDSALRWYYAHCSAVVSASFEDYGLTPLEGLAFGRPSVVVRWGGFIDTVIEGETGVFFDRPEPQLIAAAIGLATEGSWDDAALARQSARFSPAQFAARLQHIVREVA